MIFYREKSNGRGTRERGTVGKKLASRLTWAVQEKSHGRIIPVVHLRFVVPSKFPTTCKGIPAHDGCRKIVAEDRIAGV